WTATIAGSRSFRDRGRNLTRAELVRRSVDRDLGIASHPEPGRITALGAVEDRRAIDLGTDEIVTGAVDQHVEVNAAHRAARPDPRQDHLVGDEVSGRERRRRLE